MRYKLTVNGEVKLITDRLQHVSSAYNKAIYYGKSGDIIRLLYRETPDKPWQTVKKDWL